MLCYPWQLAVQFCVSRLVMKWTTLLPHIIFYPKHAAETSWTDPSKAWAKVNFPSFQLFCWLFFHNEEKVTLWDSGKSMLFWDQTSHALLEAHKLTHGSSNIWQMHKRGARNPRHGGGGEYSLGVEIVEVLVIMTEGRSLLIPFSTE